MILFPETLPGPIVQFSKTSNQTITVDENDLNIPENRKLTTGRKNTYSLGFNFNEAEKEIFEDFYDNIVNGVRPFMIKRPDKLNELMEVTFTSDRLSFEHDNLRYILNVNVRET